MTALHEQELATMRSMLTDALAQNARMLALLHECRGTIAALIAVIDSKGGENCGR